MRHFLLLFAFILFSNATKAQFIKEKSIKAEIGMGISSPNQSATDFTADGFIAQGEFVLTITSWFQLRPYAGFVSASSNGKDKKGNPTDEEVVTRAFLLGGKVRIKAPIPWVAPYFELGAGISAGKFKTLTASHDVSKNGVVSHIPVSLGLELGKNNSVDLAFAYYFQPIVKQTIGGFTVGLTFPLK